MNLTYFIYVTLLGQSWVQIHTKPSKHNLTRISVAERERQMATSEEVVAAAPESAALEAGLKHKLERKWTFWCDNQSKPKQGAAWGTSLRKVYTFDTVEEFWWYKFSLPPPFFCSTIFIFLISEKGNLSMQSQILLWVSMIDATDLVLRKNY